MAKKLESHIIIWWVLEQENPKILNIIAIIRIDYHMKYDNNDITKACSFLHFLQLKYQRNLQWNCCPAECIISVRNVRIWFDADIFILWLVMQGQNIFRNIVYVRKQHNELSYQEIRYTFYVIINIWIKI